MLRLRLSLVICLTAASQFALAGDWEHNFETAERQAKSSGATLLVHFYADWCGPCRAMERSVLQTADVRQALGKGLIGVKINSDHRSDLVKRFGIRTLPSDVFISSDGRVTKSSGAQGLSTYVARLNRFRATMTARADSAIAQAKVKSQTATAPVVGDRETTVKTSLETDKPTLTKADTPPPSTVTQAVEGGTDANVTETAIAEQQTPDAEAHEEQVVASRDKSDETMEQSSLQGENNPGAAVPVDRRTRVVKLIENKKLGLNGYSPVTLVNARQWNKGSREFRHEVQGVCYFLRNQQELDQFRANPKQFTPVLHGYDPVTLQQDDRLEAGAIELGATYKKRLYFFANAENRSTFIQNPGAFAKSAELTLTAAANSTQKF